MTQRHPIQNDVMMHITTNVRNRQKLFLNPVYAREAIEVLYRVQELHPFFLYAFVIMPDHCHFLLHVTSPLTVSKIMDRWKMGVSHSIATGPIWQRRFFVKIPDNSHSAKNYIHQNPVNEGLCEIAEEYPWSSASGTWDVTPLDMML